MFYVTDIINHPKHPKVLGKKSWCSNQNCKSESIIKFLLFSSLLYSWWDRSKPSSDQIKEYWINNSVNKEKARSIRIRGQKTNNIMGRYWPKNETQASLYHQRVVSQRK